MRERALIAEDNDDMRDLLQEVLEDAGYKTLVAANGRQALAHIEKDNEVIDLVITDVRMPDRRNPRRASGGGCGCGYGSPTPDRAEASIGKPARHFRNHERFSGDRRD